MYLFQFWFPHRIWLGVELLGHMVVLFLGKERKKRKNRYAKLIAIDKEDLYTLKINCKEKRTVGKANKGKNVEKI